MARRTELLSVVGLLLVVLLGIGGLQRANRTRIPPDGVYGPPDDRWAVLLVEEFPSSSLRPMWATCYWWYTDGCTNRGNNELQWYVPEQVVAGDGVARLVAVDEPITNAEGERWSHRSGMLTTGPKVHDGPSGLPFTYGHVEVRARIPTGSGLWPAIWLLPADEESRPEIDMMEVLGDTPETLRMHLHFHDEDGARASLGKDVEVPGLPDGIHTYGLTWTDDRLVFWLDGREVWTVEEPQAIPHEPMYLLANLAVGGDWPGPPGPDTTFPATFEIHSVRIWQAP